MTEYYFFRARDKSELGQKVTSENGEDIGRVWGTTGGWEEALDSLYQRTGINTWKQGSATITYKELEKENPHARSKITIEGPGSDFVAQTFEKMFKGIERSTRYLKGDRDAKEHTDS